MIHSFTMKSNIFYLACILAVAVGFANADEPERIVGGTNAAPNQFPFAVSLRRYNQHFCGGALISNQHVLTAAHCIRAMQTMEHTSLTVVTGTNNVRSGGLASRVARMFVHPQYSDSMNWYYDIGIIKLATAIDFNAAQQKIDLPAARPPPNSIAVVAAWGNTAAPPHGQLSPFLQFVRLRTLSTAECQKHHRQRIGDIMICTLERVNVGTCSGDSGSPLIFNNRVVGVVSGGIPCARGIPDIFTNVHHFLGWIHQTMRL